MSLRRETAAFALILAASIAGFFSDSLFHGKILSPADALYVSASFRPESDAEYEPENRLLMDPVLQFQPWLEFNRSMIRQGRLPLWNPYVGCGAPHLANAQSAVFDPFQIIAYVGELPDALAWMAAARLWVAGLGMFVLARRWGLGIWGRWFAGLCFPYCGFITLWLLYPVTNVAIWLPWVLWASDRALERPDRRRIGTLAIFTGFAILGGHIQTTAHVLLAAGLYAVAYTSRSWSSASIQNLFGWAAGIALGILIGAVTILPLAGYLTQSPVWEDRERQLESPLAITRPRLADAACTAIPYLYGSQRRGHPNLARALGVHNLNESAGGCAGLATLLWLAPQAWLARRNQWRVAFLAGLVAVGFLGSFGIAPVANVLRAVPILNVMDNRRLTLWVAFGLLLLGGIGLDHLELQWSRRTERAWISLLASRRRWVWLLPRIASTGLSRGFGRGPRSIMPAPARSKRPIRVCIDRGLSGRCGRHSRSSRRHLLRRASSSDALRAWLSSWQVAACDTTPRGVGCWHSRSANSLALDSA